MAKRASRTQILFQRFWSGVYDGFLLAVMVSFLSTTLVPAKALAFVDDIEDDDQRLIFVRDTSLMELKVKQSLVEGSVVQVMAAAYSSTVGETDGSPYITASGRRVAKGTIAANFIPLGTKVRIDGKKYTVWDRMNKRYNDKYIVDIWKPSRQEAVMHGVRIVELEIVSLPNG